MVKTGDRVRFLNDTGGGIVRGFIGKNLVRVENEDGFEIPTLITELVVIEDESEKRIYQKKEPELSKPSTQAKKKIGEVVPQPVIKEGKNRPSFFFAFVPENASNPVGGDIHAWLVNDSNFSVIYHYSHLKDKGYETIKTGKAGSNSKTKLETFVQSDLNNLPDFSFHLIPYLEKDNRKIEFFSRTFSVNPVKFYKEKSFTPSSFFASNAMILEISGSILTNEANRMTDQDFKEMIKQKEAEAVPTVTSEPKKANPEIVEVDLHLHQLVESTTGMENSDMLEFQMNNFFDEMNKAIKSGVKRIVFIHGIGQGTLKNEIRKELSTRYKKYYFQDASFKEYGYGATMVILKK